MASVSCAAALALARVLAFAIVVDRLTTALALTLVLTLARVFSFLSVVHRLEADTCAGRGARSVSAHCRGPCQQAGNRGSSNQCFGWFHYVLVFLLV